MYGPLALLVVATAVFAAGVVWWRLRGRETDPAPGAVDLARAVRARLEAAGVTITPFAAPGP